MGAVITVIFIVAGLLTIVVGTIQLTKWYGPPVRIWFSKNAARRRDLRIEHYRKLRRTFGDPNGFGQYILAQMIISGVTAVFSLLMSAILYALARVPPALDADRLVPSFFFEESRTLAEILSVLLVLVSVFTIFKMYRLRNSLSRSPVVLAGIERELTDLGETGLELIDSFPKDNEYITVDQVNNIYLKFNKPVDVNSAKYIVTKFRGKTTIQWDTTDFIEFLDNNTKLVWHPNERLLHKPGRFVVPSEAIDYPVFEIHVGRGSSDSSLKGEDGSVLPFTVIKVKITPP